MIFLVLFLFAWACYVSYQLGRQQGLEDCYDYIEENVEEFLKSIEYK